MKIEAILNNNVLSNINNCLLTDTLIFDFCAASSVRKLSVIVLDANLDAEYGPIPGNWPIRWEATLEKIRELNKTYQKTTSYSTI